MIVLDDAAITQLKGQIEDNIPHYANESGAPWVQTMIEGIDEEVLVQDDTLIASPDPKHDGENAILLYEKMKNISSTLASSDHYWTTLAHTSFYQYVYTRWIRENTEELKPGTIETRFFFSSTNQKSRARHALTRLWWIAHLTHDPERESDPYFYTKVATTDQDLYGLIMETKHVAQNKMALFAMLDVFLEVFEKVEREEIELKNKRKFFRETMQQINLIGSVTVWDLLSREEAKRKLSAYVYDYLEQG